MTRSIVVVGAGGFGREALDVLEAVNATAAADGREEPWSLLGVLDDSPSALNLRRLDDRNVRYLGTVERISNHLGDDAGNGTRTAYVVGVGSPGARRRVAAGCDAAGLEPVVLVHPDATVGSRSSLGPGTVACAGARVSTNVTLGRHVHLNANATVGHDTVLEDYVSLNPLAAVSGDCVVESGALIGAAALVLQGVRVGRNVLVGGSACVTSDVEPDRTVVGVPARPMRTGCS